MTASVTSQLAQYVGEFHASGVAKREAEMFQQYGAPSQYGSIVHNALGDTQASQTMDGEDHARNEYGNILTSFLN